MSWLRLRHAGASRQEGRSRDQIAQGVGGVVTPGAVIGDVDLEDVFRPVGVVLEERERGQEAAAARVDNEPRRAGEVGNADQGEDGGPAGNAVQGSAPEADAVRGVVAGHGATPLSLAKASPPATKRRIEATERPWRASMARMASACWEGTQRRRACSSQIQIVPSLPWAARRTTV